MTKKKIIYWVIGIFLVLAVINSFMGSSDSDSIIEKYSGTYWEKVGGAFSDTTKLFEGYLSESQKNTMDGKAQEYYAKFLKCIDTEISQNYSGEQAVLLRSAKEESDLEQHFKSSQYEALGLKCVDRYVESFSTEVAKILK